jgi:predicted porin
MRGKAVKPGLACIRPKQTQIFKEKHMTKMNKAVAAAVLAMSATAANAGIVIPAGDWTVDIGGNVNTYYTNTKWDGDLDSNLKNAPTHDSANNISTGLLPSALGIGAKTRQNDLDVAVQFTFFVGANSTGGGSGVFGENGAGGNSINIRQAFATFGDKSWGSIKFGRDLGIFGSDAILSDMTLLGVGIGAGGTGSSTLGRIGAGYLYADWVGQISYASPNWNGFSFNVGLRSPWGNAGNEDLGYEGKASYEWGGDISGKVWVGGVHQKVTTAATAASSSVGITSLGAPGVIVTPATSGSSDDAHAWEIGGKVNVAGFGLVGYYYDGKGIGQNAVATATELSGLIYGNGDRDVDGGYVQGTYTIPGVGTKIGVSWGESNVDGNNAEADFKSEAWMLGVYHPLTKSVNLVAEYIDTQIDNNGGVHNVDGDIRTVALGAILFF